MPFVIRPYHRLPTVCPVIYERLYDEGHGTIWNLSPTGLRLSGTLLLPFGDVCSLKLQLPASAALTSLPAKTPSAATKQVSVLAGVVLWVHGDEFGIETLLMEKRDKARLAAYIRDRMQEL
ncbi:MAG: PilZ domain-containing protein [Nitrospira sp.]|nr:MAG: PilZ domain-containing protein [Nitrospira sp.]